MLYKLIYCDIIIISIGLGGDFVEITNLYLKTEELFKSFKENKIDLAPFHNIAKEILVYINVNDITYSELSNKGEIHHHSVNVAILGGKLGMFYNVNNIYNLILGSLLHDVGKFYINQSILNKKEKLSEIERLVVAEHTTIGHKVISYYTNNKIIADIILKHHSIFNEIPINTDVYKLEDNQKYPLLCGIADITDAVLSHRSYKKPLPKEVIFIDLDEKGIINYQKELNALLKNIA